MQDLSSKKQTRITTSGKAMPAIYGNRIVWIGDHNGKLDVYMYDISSKKETQLSTSGRVQGFIAIYGNRVVYLDIRNGNYDVYMYDLSTKKETQIISDKSDSSFPAIYDNSIVWIDNRSGNWNIYAYDLVTHQEIHTTKSDQRYPAIYVTNWCGQIIAVGSISPISTWVQLVSFPLLLLLHLQPLENIL